MKTRFAVLALMAVTSAMLSFNLVACRSNSNTLSYDDEYGFCNGSGLQNQLTSYALQELNSTEKASLAHMREEEKLARDIYTTLYQTWGSQVFSNIAASEQTHMDAVKLLLQRYALSDPASPNPGVFSDSSLQQLYNQLREKGMKSLADAYTVGSMIEDLDLADLASTPSIDNNDIKYIYDNLARGTRNHMRAFARNLSSLGLSYTPTHISQSSYTSIINGDMESGGCGR